MLVALVSQDYRELQEALEHPVRLDQLVRKVLLAFLDREALRANLAMLDLRARRGHGAHLATLVSRGQSVPQVYPVWLVQLDLLGQLVRLDLSGQEVMLAQQGILEPQESLEHPDLLEIRALLGILEIQVDRDHLVHRVTVETPGNKEILANLEQLELLEMWVQLVHLDFLDCLEMWARWDLLVQWARKDYLEILEIQVLPVSLALQAKLVWLAQQDPMVNQAREEM